LFRAQGWTNDRYSRVGDSFLNGFAIKFFVVVVVDVVVDVIVDVIVDVMVGVVVDTVGGGLLD